MVWDDEPLFEEDFQAWANGPVCPELFRASQGQFSVTAAELQGDPSKLTDSQRGTVDKVLDYYGNKNAQWLSQLTHMEEPWRKARKGLPADAYSHAVITKESMAMYYGGL